MEWRKNDVEQTSFEEAMSFNPCSNGMKKERRRGQRQHTGWIRFNPCSNGMKKEPLVAMFAFGVTVF